MIGLKPALLTTSILTYLSCAYGLNPSFAPDSASNTVPADMLRLAYSPRHANNRSGPCSVPDRTYDFTVILSTSLDSKTARVGDPVKARLAEDVRNHRRLVAATGSILTGWITSVDRARKEIKSDVPGKHWLNANGAIGFVLTEMHTPAGKTYEFRATPRPHSEVHGINARKPSYVVDKRGELTVPYNGKAYGVMGAAVGGEALATGPVGLIAGPVLSGIAGAAKPAYAYDHPVEGSVDHKRLKGFFKGMVKGVPGGFLLAGVSNHGQNVRIPAGARLDVIAR